MTRHSTKLAIPFLMLFFATTPLRAQVERSAGGGQTQKIMQQYQQVAAEKTALQAQVTQMKKDLDAANSSLAQVTKERDALKNRTAAAPSPTIVAKLTASKETAEKNLEQYKQRMGELVARYRETATNLKEVEADRSKISKQLEERNGAFDKCVEDNMQLYEINGEILDRYDHVGLFTKVSTVEPFTRLTRTRIDNLVVEYRARAQELRVKKPAP